MNNMVEASAEMKSTIRFVHDMMRHVKTRLKNAAILRNLTDLCSVLHNATRWTGKCMMLQIFGEIKNEVIQACDKSDVDISSDYEFVFTNRVPKYERMLAAINIATAKLQGKDLTLASCRYVFDTLIQAVNEEKMNVDRHCSGAS